MSHCRSQLSDVIDSSFGVLGSHVAPARSADSLAVQRVGRIARRDCDLLIVVAVAVVLLGMVFSVSGNPVVGSLLVAATWLLVPLCLSCATEALEAPEPARRRGLDAVVTSRAGASPAARCASGGRPAILRA